MSQHMSETNISDERACGLALASSDGDSRSQDAANAGAARGDGGAPDDASAAPGEAPAERAPESDPYAGRKADRDRSDHTGRNGSEPAGPESIFDHLDSMMGEGNPNRQGGNRSGGHRPGGGRRGPSRMSWLYTLIACALVAYLVFTMNGGFAPRGDMTELATNEFVTAVEEGRVDSVTYTVANGDVSGTYWTSEKNVGDDGKLANFTSTYVGSDALADLMAAHPDTTYIVNTNNPNALTDFLILSLIHI